SDGDSAGVRQALDHGIDVSQPIKTSQALSWTPLILAACQGNVEVLQLLLDHGADINQSDWTERKQPQLSSLRYLYNNAGLDAFVDHPTPIARTALGWAAFYGHVGAIGFLIEAGADATITDALKMTALHAAALGNQPKAIQRLLESGFDLHGEAFDKLTPLHIAAEAGATKAIDTLLAAGADPARKNKRGETPYQAAKECGKTDACRRLQPHTPQQPAKKKRKAKVEKPSLVGGKTTFRKILGDAKKQYGAESRKLTTDRFRKGLAKAAAGESFLASTEKIRKQLKSQDLTSHQDFPQTRWIDQVKITDNRLLRLQQEHLSDKVFLVRALRKQDDRCRVYLLPTDDLFAVLGAFGTDGINFEIDTQRMIAWLMDLHQRYPYRLVGVAHDGLEIRFDQSVDDPETLVGELLTICPAEDDEAQSIKWLRRRLKSKTPQVFLWWD
ncbi:MAG: ankyrin repeat domain-containing protein, partial [Pirellulales bacterium]|nr:ankyrin repeat domain-containing protein [Pirellulales bacterium]